MLIGTTLRQRYKIVKELKQGGFGETYLAEDYINIPVIPKPKCVVKRLKPEKRDNSDTVARFDREAATLEKLGNKHDQIPKLIDYFEENLDFYLVQELIDGHDLSYEITQGDPWTEAEVIQLLKEILEVLAFVHQHNVIHRDVKPSNIMRRYCDGKLMLIDFGAVKELALQAADVQGQMSSTLEVGTRRYRSSEQSNGHPKLCSDLYALGLTAIEALTGIPPNQLRRNEKLEVIWREQAQVSDALAGVLTKMVRYHFDQRYQSATEALQALEQALKVPRLIDIDNKNIRTKLAKSVSRTQLYPPHVPGAQTDLERAICLLGNRIRSNLGNKAHQKLVALVGAYPNTEEATLWKQYLRQVAKRGHKELSVNHLSGL